MKMVRCERYSSRMTTRLAKLSGLGLASRPAYSSVRREAAAQAAYRRARRLLPITRCDGRTAAQAAHRRMTRLQAGLSARPVSRKSVTRA